MRVFRTHYRFHEVSLDDDGEAVVVYETDLPHGAAIVSAAVADWNANVTPAFVSCPTRDKVASVRAARTRADRDAMVVTVRARDGESFDSADVTRLMDDFDGMFCDGWGERFCGPANVMHDEGGRRFYAE